MQFKNQILASLQPEAQAFVREFSESRPMRTGDVVFDDGGPVTHAIFPHSGVISIMAEMQDFRTVEKTSIGREGFVGFSLILGGGPVLGRSIVQVAGDATWISMENLDIALSRFSCVREAMLLFAKAHIVQLMELVACNSLHTAEQRISRWLMQAHDRVDGDTFYLTQDAIARLMALRRATVNTVCSELSQIGSIAYHRGALTITDRALLHSRACECYDRIRRAEPQADRLAPDEPQ